LWDKIIVTSFSKGNGGRMKPTDDLREEHRVIKSVLPILDRVCVDIESGRSVKQDNLEGLIEFIKEFIEEHHYTKEEAYLFPEMEKAGVSGAEELITSLRNEHEEERQSVSKIGKIVFEKEENMELSSMVEYLRAYIRLLNLHIDKEENRLFPMVDTYLSQAVQKDLLKSFEDMETQIDSERYAELKIWLNTMGETYTKPA